MNGNNLILFVTILNSQLLINDPATKWKVLPQLLYHNP